MFSWLSAVNTTVAEPGSNMTRRRTKRKIANLRDESAFDNSLLQAEALRAVAQVMRDQAKVEFKPKDRPLPPLIYYPWPEKEPPSRLQRLMDWVRNRSMTVFRT